MMEKHISDVVFELSSMSAAVQDCIQRGPGSTTIYMDCNCTIISSTWMESETRRTHTYIICIVSLRLSQSTYTVTLHVYEIACGASALHA